MEELLPSLKGMLKEAIDIDPDASIMTIKLTIKQEIEGIIASNIALSCHRHFEGGVWITSYHKRAEGGS